MADALRPFGWTMGEDFWRRYHSDAWVFNLANAVERLTAQLDEAQLRSIEARNPGIDMERVKAERASSGVSHSFGSPEHDGINENDPYWGRDQ